jgi:predicted outer membrane repeat protein
MDNNANSGAAAYIESSPQSTISSSLFMGNKARDGGGAVYCLACPSLVLDRNKVINNQAKEGGGAYIDSSDNTLLFSNEFKGNEAKSGGGLSIKSNVKYGDSATISSCSFTSNSASTSASSDAGAARIAGISISISSSNFEGNYAAQQGGALVCFALLGFSVHNSSFISNTAGTRGGAVALSKGAKNSTSIISSSIFIANSANKDRGGAMIFERTLFISSSSFRNNSAKTWGGAIAGSQVSSLAISTSSFVNSSSGDDGGALYIKCTTSTPSLKVSLSSTSFLGNVGKGTGGSANIASCQSVEIYNSTFEQNSAQEHGGGVNIDSSKTATVLSSSFTNNRAIKEGAGMRFKNVIYVSVKHSFFSANKADEGGGFGFHSSGLQTSIFLVCENTTFIGNTAKSLGGGLSISRENSGEQNNITASLLSVTLRENSVVDKSPNALIRGGGGVFIDKSVILSMRDSIIGYNYADTIGGGLFLNMEAQVTVDGSMFTNNAANAVVDVKESKEAKGGAFGASISCSITLRNSSFIKNRADQGGAMYLNSSNALFMKDVILHENVAAQGPGGALHAMVLNKITAVNASIKRNFAINDGDGVNEIQKGGGAISLTFINSITITNSTLDGNVARGFGGGALFAEQYNTVLVEGTTFRANKASASGGAVLLRTSQIISFTKSLFERNIAEMGYGGAIDTGKNLKDFIFFKPIFINLFTVFQTISNYRKFEVYI